MSNKAEERLSALMDDELADFEQDIDSLEDSDSLKQRWMRYHLIRDVVSGHLPDTVAPDFDLAARVSAALEHEPTILAPRRFQPRQLMKQAAGLAIAASVSAIAIVSIQNQNLDGDSGNVASPGPVAVTETQVNNVISFNPLPGTTQAQSPVTARDGQAALVSLSSAKSARGATVVLSRNGTPRIYGRGANPASTSKFNGYLLNHNEYSVSANIQGMLPYMRIVGATRSQPVIIRVDNEK